MRCSACRKLEATSGSVLTIADVLEVKDLRKLWATAEFRKELPGFTSKTVYVTCELCDAKLLPPKPSAERGQDEETIPCDESGLAVSGLTRSRRSMLPPSH